MPTYALEFDINSGICYGAAYYGNDPTLVVLPTNQIQCSSIQMANPSEWEVQNGTIVAATPTTQTQAIQMYASGIQIVSTANPSTLNGSYPIDPATSSEAGALLASINAGLTIPGGVIQWPDTAGNPHPFSPSDFKNLCQAMLNFRLTLAPLIAGAPGTLPSQPSTIA